MMNEINEPDGDYDPIGTELQSLRFMIGDLDARLKTATDGELLRNHELREMCRALERRLLVRDSAYIGLEDRVASLEFTVEQTSLMQHNEILDDFAARIKVLEDARAEPPATCPDCGHPVSDHGPMGCRFALGFAGLLCKCALTPEDATPAPTWPAPDCAAVAGEALPVIDCDQCAEPATRIRLSYYSEAMPDIATVAPVCNIHGGNSTYITGEPARAILHAIAREAARVRQGGAG